MRCYSCHSDSIDGGQDCNDPANFNEIECRNGEDHCVKVVLGPDDVTRSCGLDRVEVGCKGTPETSEHCVCDSDLCNGAETYKATSGLAFVVAVALARLLQ